VEEVHSGVKLVFTELTARSRTVVRLVAAALVVVIAYSLVPGVAGDPVWGNIPFTLLAAAFGAAGVSMAMKLPITTKARFQAFLLAAGIVAYVLGDLIWMYYEIGRGVLAPYPGLADFFYGPAMYAPLAVATWSALLSLRRLEDSLKPLLIAGSVTVFAALALWSTVLMRIAESPDVAMSEKVVSLGYPLADVFVLLFPTLALIVVLADIGGVPLARPWYSIATAMLVLAASDAAYSYLQVHDVYVTGSLLDTGWLIAFGMIVVGISRMLDVYSAEEA